VPRVVSWFLDDIKNVLCAARIVLRSVQERAPAVEIHLQNLNERAIRVDADRDFCKAFVTDRRWMKKSDALISQSLIVARQVLGDEADTNKPEVVIA